MGGGRGWGRGGVDNAAKQSDQQWGRKPETEDGLEVACNDKDNCNCVKILCQFVNQKCAVV